MELTRHACSSGMDVVLGMRIALEWYSRGLWRSSCGSLCDNMDASGRLHAWSRTVAALNFLLAFREVDVFHVGTWRHDQSEHGVNSSVPRFVFFLHRACPWSRARRIAPENVSSVSSVRSATRWNGEAGACKRSEAEASRVAFTLVS